MCDCALGFGPADRPGTTLPPLVMAGLDPAIHQWANNAIILMDCRVIPDQVGDGRPAMTKLAR
jgi:hypothetical protein